MQTDRPDTWLSPEEVAELTDRQRWKAQCRALSKMGVPFKPNAVGRPLVERAIVCKGAPKPRAAAEPNWNAIKSRAA